MEGIKLALVEVPGGPSKVLLELPTSCAAEQPPESSMFLTGALQLFPKGRQGGQLLVVAVAVAAVAV